MSQLSPARAAAHGAKSQITDVSQRAPAEKDARGRLKKRRVSDEKLRAVKKESWLLPQVTKANRIDLRRTLFESPKKDSSATISALKASQGRIALN
jgi:hypothetical protein